MPPPEVLVAVGLATGILVGLTGTGAGSVTTPLLLFFGVNPVVAVGSDLVYGTVTKSVGAWRHLRLGTVHLNWVVRLALGSVPGVLVGSLLVQRVHAAHLIKPVLGAVLVASALWTLARELSRWWTGRRQAAGEPSPLRRRQRRAATLSVLPAPPDAERSPTWVVTAAGLVVGLLVGFTSAGSGPLIAVVLFAASDLKVHDVVGTDIAHAVLLLGAGALAHWSLGQVDLRLVALLSSGSVPGVILGSWLSRRAPVLTLKAAVNILVLLAGISMI